MPNIAVNSQANLSAFESDPGIKILHLGKYFPPFRGGLENYLRDAMVALQQNGFESAALVHRHEWSFRTLDDHFVASGCRFRVVRTGRWAHLLFTPISPLLPWHLHRLIKAFKPDILHLHLPNPSVFWVLVLASARHLPWVVHWHADVITEQQSGLMGLAYKLYEPFEHAVLRRSCAIIATSKPYLDTSAPLRNFKTKCHVVPLGVDVKRFHSSERVRGNPSGAGDSQPKHSPALRVLAVGRLTYYKGFRFLLEAAAKAPGIEVHIVGRGDQGVELRKLAASLNLQDRVTFHGVLGETELAQQMRYCDCLCLPSIERTEAFGMVLLEAMYFGKATIISDLPDSGMGWVVDAGITGLKVKPADADALATALEQLNTDRGKLAMMGQAGKQKFDQKFEINHAVKDLLDVYRKVVSSRLANTQKP